MKQIISYMLLLASIAFIVTAFIQAFIDEFGVALTCSLMAIVSFGLSRAWSTEFITEWVSDDEANEFPWRNE